MLNVLRIPVRRQQILLLAVDLALLFLSLPVAILVRSGIPAVDSPFGALRHFPAAMVEMFRYYTGAMCISVAVFVCLFFVFDLYSTERPIGTLRDLAYILLACGAAVLVISVFYYFLPFWRVSRSFLPIQAAFVGLTTFAARALYSRVHHRITRPRRALIIGAGRSAGALLEEIHQGFKSEIEVVGVLEDDPRKVNFELNGYRVIGGTKDLARIADERGVEIVIFAIPGRNNPIDPDLMRGILGLKASGTEVYQMATFFKKITGRIPVDFIEDSWLIFGQSLVTSTSGMISRVRRLADVGIALGALMLLSPFLLAIAAAIKLTSPGPVFYRQERLGLNRRPYQMIKFRTMRADAEGGGGPVWSSGKRDARVTGIGRILRRTRMDEIPNFLNVLRGDMSVVGPRPERAHFVEMLEREIPYYGLRFAVKPGLTGWAQVNYSYGASLDDARKKLQYEVFYIQERSLMLDLIIMLKTAQTVLLRPGS